MFCSPYKAEILDVTVSYKFKMALIWNKNVMNDAQPRISILLPCTAW